MARQKSSLHLNVAMIRVAARLAGKTQADVASEMGIHEVTLAKKLSGKLGWQPKDVTGLCKALSLPPYLLQNDAKDNHLEYVRQIDARKNIERPYPYENGITIEEVRKHGELLVDYGLMDSPMPAPTEVEGFQSFDFWKKDAILPFRSDKAIEFWEYDGDEILVRGPARCGKSTLILEWIITQMFKHRGLQVLITRAFSVDLDAVRQNILDLCKYNFADPLSSIRTRGGAKFHTIEINGGAMELKGIDRPGSQLGAGYDVVIHSQAEQVKKEQIDVINSRCSPASQNWVEDGIARSLVIYDVNPNRLDHWIERAIKDGLKHIDMDFIDHPAYFTEDGTETELYQRVYSRLSRLEGVWRKRLLEGKAANPEGAIFELQDCHLLQKLPRNFKKTHQFYRGFDFGMKDPSVILWFAVHRSRGDVIVFREWRRVGVDTIEMGAAAKRYTDEPVTATIIDNDENLQSILQKNCGIPTQLASKGPNSIASGITLIQHRLKKAVDGEDGGLYFYDSPVERDAKLIADNQPLTVVQESELYAWAENADKPIDQHNHGWDVIRYVLDYLEHGGRAVGFAGGGATRQRRASF